MTVERMIELLEIEKECVLRNASGECNRYCAECDLLQDDTELHEMYTEVIAILKAQEPRVMTLDEINAVKQNDVLVYESNAAFKAIFHFIVTEGVVDNELRIKTEFERIDMTAPLETYNRVWRCWTSQPTEEQREAEVWSD